MQKVILIRYGEWENGHSNETGRQTIAMAAERLKLALDLSTPDLKANVCVVSAEVPQAIESAQALIKALEISSTTSLPQLCISEDHEDREEGKKEGWLPDAAAAFHAILGLEQVYNHEFTAVLAMVSREYIEALPPYILTEIFHRPAIEGEKPHLERGRALVFDLTAQTMRFI